MKIKIINFGVTFGVGLAISFLYMWTKGLFSMTESLEIFKILSDAFFVPGVIILGAGFLIFSSNEGTFDMLSFGVGKAFSVFKINQTTSKYKTFYEYRKAKSQQHRSFLYLIVIGGIFLALCGVFLYLFSVYSTI